MSSRVQKIKDTYSEQFQHRLEQEHVNISTNSAWDILISADPSPNKKNVRWLVETYIEKGYLWEDIMGGPTSKVSETLTEFDKHKCNLEPSERSLMIYKTLGSLWSAIKPYVGQLTHGEEKKEDRERAYAEAEVIVDREDGFKVVSPKTEYAAKWFGRGTRWCTSAENNNMFDEYNKIAPLIIAILPNGDKIQLWKDKDSVQFMDQNDDEIQLSYISDNWEYLKELCIKSESMSYIPDAHVTYEIAYNLCDCNSLNFVLTNPCFRTKELCEKAVKKDGSAFHIIPHELKTEDMFILALKNTGSLLPSYKTLFKKELTYELCKIAANTKQCVFNIIPDEFLTDELYELMAKNNVENICNFPAKYKTEEALCRYVTYNPKAFLTITKEFITPKICDALIEAEPSYFIYIPHDYQTYERAKKAVSKNSKAILNMEATLLSKELCDMAVKGDLETFHYIPSRFKTDELKSIYEQGKQKEQGVDHSKIYEEFKKMYIDEKPILKPYAQ